MGFDPNKMRMPSPAEQKVFDLGIFSDMYRAIQDEFGVEWAKQHVAIAGIHIDDKGKGRLQCSGDGQQMQALVGMLIVRLAQTYGEAQLADAKKRGMKIAKVDLKRVAHDILRNIWKKVDSLEEFKQNT